MSNNMSNLAAALAGFLGFGTNPPSFDAFSFVGGALLVAVVLAAALGAFRGRAFFGAFFGPMFRGEFGGARATPGFFGGGGFFASFFQGFFGFFTFLGRGLASVFWFFAGLFSRVFRLFFGRGAAASGTGTFDGQRSPVQGGSGVSPSPFPSRRTPGHVTT